MNFRLPPTHCALLGLAFAGAVVGCGSDQSSAGDAQVAGSGVAGSRGGSTAHGGTGATNGGSGGTSGATPSQAGASAGGSANSSSGGQSSNAGANSQAGNAGRGGNGGAVGAGGAVGVAGGNHAGAAGSVSTAGGGSSGTQPNITVWIAGDSTVANGSSCPIGWGAQFKALFNGKVAVTNSAVGGRSVRTWMYDVQDTKDSAGECNLGKDTQGNPTIQSRWTAMLNGMKSGDYLFIQFGINDGDSSCPRHVGVSAFKASYGVLAQAAKDRGAQPVFVTPVSQIACSGSNVSKGTREPYVTATKDAGTQFSVPVIDLNLMSTTLYQSLGFCPIPGGSDVSASTTGAVGAFFCDDHTHFDTPGATQIAGLVAQGVRDQKLGLAAYLK
jgi:lysophospholipase L1-like esterase